jgi:hypothetical protein
MKVLLSPYHLSEYHSSAYQFSLFHCRWSEISVCRSSVKAFVPQFPNGMATGVILIEPPRPGYQKEMHLKVGKFLFGSSMPSKSMDRRFHGGFF